MKGVLIVLMCIVLLGCTPEVKEEIIKEERNMQIKSNAFEDSEMIPAKFTCQGEDINPQLSIEDIPENAKSLALIIDDPDAPVDTWIHWLVKDIPVDVKEITENSIPGTQVLNSFGKEDYGGPCPPSGVHRYFFKLYALDVKTFEASSKKEFYDKVEEHKIEETILMGKYTKG